MRVPNLCANISAVPILCGRVGWMSLHDPRVLASAKALAITIVLVPYGILTARRQQDTSYAHPFAELIQGTQRRYLRTDPRPSTAIGVNMVRKPSSPAPFVSSSPEDVTAVEISGRVSSDPMDDADKFFWELLLRPRYFQASSNPHEAVLHMSWIFSNTPL